ncbi:MAG: phosphoribosyltransferase family protein, partial [Synechococcus sp.]
IMAGGHAVSSAMDSIAYARSSSTFSIKNHSFYMLLSFCPVLRGLVVNYISYDELSKDIYCNLDRIHKLNIDLVVGIPRSGMIPAYMIALALNVICIDLDALIHNREVNRGQTRKLRFDHEEKLPHDFGNILLVDDTIFTGNSLKRELQKIPASLRGKITTFAVYSSKKKRNDIDQYLKFLPGPRIFEWSIFHHRFIGRSCVDIDGVLCFDPTEEQNDDGEKYINFILNAPPKFLPTGEVDALVTNRLEKYRPQTKLWLDKHNIKYKKLIMLDLPSKEERQKSGANFTHKPEYYRKSDNIIFIESDISQAKTIHQKTGKAVFCVDANILIDSNYFIAIKKDPVRGIKSSMRILYKRLKKNVRRSLKRSIK